MTKSMTETIKFIICWLYGAIVGSCTVIMILVPKEYWINNPNVILPVLIMIFGWIGAGGWAFFNIMWHWDSN